MRAVYSTATSASVPHLPLSHPLGAAKPSDALDEAFMPPADDQKNLSAYAAFLSQPPPLPA
jgi:hypothetical protein